MQEDSWSQGLNPKALAAAREVARTLGQAGHRAWLVGGCVRDLLLGKMPHDLDLVSSASPDEVEALFPRTVAVGKAFGVLRVLMGEFDFEVATFRSEGDYSDGRHPDEVHLVPSAEIDATRRDFTCNALYLDPLDGTRLDPTGGLEDLKNKLLVAVGDPTMRFAEDALRLLRMARFEGSHGLAPSPGLHSAAQGAAAGLARVSPERVLDEFQKIAAGPNPALSLEVLVECSLLGFALPALPPGGEPARIAAVKAMMEDDRRDSTSTLAALLDPGAQQQEPLLDSLPLSKVLRRDLADTWRFRSRCVNLAAQDGFDPAERARTLRGDQGRRGLVLARAQCRSREGIPESLDQMLAWAADAILFVEPLLTGTQLTALGMVPGPAVGRMLRDLEDEQLRGTIKKVAEAEAFVRKTIANQA